MKHKGLKSSSTIFFFFGGRILFRNFWGDIILISCDLKVFFFFFFELMELFINIIPLITKNVEQVFLKNVCCIIYLFL